MRWMKPGAWGFVIGSVLTMVLGFSWGGWMTGSGADRLVLERSSAAVVSALVPVCIEKSKSDPALGKRLAELRTFTSSWQQSEAVMRDGWATIGSGEANREVAEACASQLVKVAAN